MRRPALRLVHAVALTLLLSACGSSGGGTRTSEAPRPSASGTPAAAAPTSPSQPDYYVSVGDSYAAGYQPTGVNRGGTTSNGFAYQLVSQAASRGYDLELVNFGCSGATTDSVLHAVGCPAYNLGPGGTAYPSQTQAAATEAFLRAHRGHIGLITVVIGGNDVTNCVPAPSPPACLASSMGTIRSNLAALLTGLRSAAGADVRIVGVTYPDVVLGGYLTSDEQLRGLAQLSVPAFKTLINPALKAEYTAVGARFVDVTAASGAYGSLDDTTTLAPYGTIPRPVAQVCTLTYICEFNDIHPRTSGYRLIADLIAKTLPAKAG